MPCSAPEPGSCDGRDPQSFSHLAGMYYDAAIEPSLWPQAAVSAAKAFDAAVVFIGIIDRRNHRVPRSFWNDDDVARSARARQRGLRSNPAASFAAQTPPLTFAGGLVLARTWAALTSTTKCCGRGR